ncbi:LAFE_0C10924g1_1 [Lachancea fermentati]|uniref:Very-long-chain (3R)-3-hydroxyacyl-CoA dehydratase n=1 Tax=Lachancea fermentati TaxID=4955 RepID=A0A1G4MA97_LACFM|nr:LAFE_0C10924g1_1 [Lachancea fermentati]
MAKQVSPLNPLALYNLVSALLWGYLLYNVLVVYPKVGQPQFFEEWKDSVTFIQCGAIIEVLNSILGIVRAPVVTTAAQVASRLLVVIGIFQYLPESANCHNVVFLTLLLAWTSTEVVRYLFYFFNLSLASGAPKFVVLLRYNLFWVLYPLGVASELLIIYSALPYAEEKYSIYFKWALIGSMFTYIPGFPVLFMHMVGQRKKVMRSLSSANNTTSTTKKTN